MKRLLMIPLLALLSSGAQAALYVNNNTNCTYQYVIVAYDINTPGCVLHSNPVTIGPMSSDAYNNVTSLNVSPGWAANYTATTTGGAGAWGWRAFVFNFQGSSVGGTVGNALCTAATTVTLPNVCAGSGTVIVTWDTPGGNVFVEIN